MIQNRKGKIKRNFRLIKAMAVTLSEEGIEILKKDEKVAYIEENAIYTASVEIPMRRRYFKQLALLGVAFPPVVMAVGLPDTGMELCDNGSNSMVACTASNIGDSATMPRQDGRFGRDPGVRGAAAAPGCPSIRKLQKDRRFPKIVN